MECVTITTVMPRRPCSESSMSSSAWRVISSSAPKGSSSRRSSGSVTSARAIDARMRMPPESWPGSLRPASASCTRSSMAAARSSRSPRGTPASSSGSATFAATLRHGRSRGSWNAKAVRGDGRVPASPRKRTTPEVGESSPPIMRRSVVLPHPEGPTSTVSEPAGTSNDALASASKPSSKTRPTPATSMRRSAPGCGAAGRPAAP